MISETAFLDCEDTPPEMVEQFDRPWHFLGEVKGELPSVMKAYCGRCHVIHFEPPQATSQPCRPSSFQVVDLPGHQFITDDMIQVVVYFGVCGNCGAVFWARQGPPFRRVRRLVPA